MNQEAMDVYIIFSKTSRGFGELRSPFRLDYAHDVGLQHSADADLLVAPLGQFCSTHWKSAHRSLGKLGGLGELHQHTTNTESKPAAGKGSKIRDVDRCTEIRAEYIQRRLSASLRCEAGRSGYNNPIASVGAGVV